MTILRLLLGLLVFIFPFVSASLMFIVDWSDGEVFKRSGYTHKVYSLYDKVFDYYWYACILLFLVINQAPGLSFFVLFFVLRSVGHIIFFITQKSLVFFFFPCVFELLFYFYLLTLFFPELSIYLLFPKIFFPLLIILPIILTREYIIHIKKANLSWFFTGKTTYWPEEKICF